MDLKRQKCTLDDCIIMLNALGVPASARFLTGALALAASNLSKAPLIILSTS